MSSLSSMSSTSSLDWDALETRVSSTSIPGYRRAWFVSLIRQGREAEVAGRSQLASHCLERVEKELRNYSVEVSAAAAPSPSTSPTSASPLAELAARRGTATRARYLEMLQRHEARLSPTERETYRAALEGADAAPVSDLRRRLVDRLLRSSRYQRQGERLAAWARFRPAAAAEVRPAGPYNDFQAVDEMVRRLAGQQPEWTAEFLDVYAGMRAVRLACGEFLPGK
jgi:hypothetical protein